MKNNTRKIFSMAVFSLASLAMVFSAGIASANSHDNRHDHGDNNNSSQPRINSGIDTTKNSATISFRARRFRNETINAIVSVKNRSTDMLQEKSYKVSLDDRGEGTVMVRGLMSGTRYDFKVRIMRMGSDRSTDNSDSRSARTM